MTEISFESHIPSFPEQHNQTNGLVKAEPLICQWKSCLKQFPDHISLSSHLSEDHIGWKKGGYCCDWDNCPRQGKQCHNRFALMMHLRIHTGEKPFECTWPNCGQTFGRMDALARHKKQEHGEETKPSNNNSPSSSTSFTTIKPKKPLKRASSSADMMSSKNKRLKIRKTLNGADWSSGDESEDSLLTSTKITPNPSSKPLVPGSSYTQYRIAKAQLLYLIRENEMLQDEYDSTQKKLRRMKTERKVLLDAVMAAELKSEDEGDPIPNIEEQISL